MRWTQPTVRQLQAKRITCLHKTHLTQVDWVVEYARDALDAGRVLQRALVAHKREQRGGIVCAVQVGRAAGGVGCARCGWGVLQGEWGARGAGGACCRGSGVCAVQVGRAAGGSGLRAGTAGAGGACCSA